MSTTVQLAGPEDAAQVAEWITRTPHNSLDSDIASYSNLCTLRIDLDGEPAVYVPVHPVLFIESVACRPGLSPRQYIAALLTAEKVTEAFARQYGIREIYTSSGYTPMIKTLRRHGYTDIVGTALRKKI